jgi:DNA polymerase-1
MSKLVLIDGNAILHRAFHALPPLTTKTGQPINAVYGLVSMLLRVIQDLKPSHIAVAFDRKEPTFRHIAFKNYQAQRPPLADELSSQFEKAKDVISAFGIPIYEKAGYEADDVIGTLASQVTQNTEHKTLNTLEEVVIVTGDRDILQLVNDSVKVYMPISGLANAKLMNETAVIEKMGVKPERIPDYKALVGDQSDNYFGVPGIGPKTAINLIARFESIDQIYKNLDKLDEKVKKKLEDAKENVLLCLKLARIVTDVPIETDFEKMNKWQIDSPNIFELFSKFGFKTLTNRVKEVARQIAQEKQMSLI